MQPSLSAAASELLAQAERGEINDAHARLLALAERELITQAIQRAGNNQRRRRAGFGLSRLTVRLKLTQLGLRQAPLDGDALNKFLLRRARRFTTVRP